MGDVIDIDEFSKNIKVVGQIVKELESTLLIGWPYDKYPTSAQAEGIVSVFGELSSQHSTMDLDEPERWRLAGQIIARIQRDRWEQA